MRHPKPAACGRQRQSAHPRIGTRDRVSNGNAGDIMKRLLVALAFALCGAAWAQPAEQAVTYFDVPRGSHPHDVAAVPGTDGVVYYTAQMTGRLGVLDPKSGRSTEIALGPGSAPHGVIVAPDGAAWITDGGQNAILR